LTGKLTGKVSQQGVAEPVNGLALHLFEHMRVGVHGQRDLAVTKLSHDRPR
jgi:hypothetical protein